MSEVDIKKLIKMYRLICTGVLDLFLMFAIVADEFLINSPTQSTL
ncbi:hypothetical protein GAB14E_0144 [Colwellia psychrerythraea]|uniref:Uncharacterized protein n=1 Tax=Colwellia psychrerythraea TaxID=28229 RepID=A0A099L245_COLPS|nr:hypothetical protein GAB14E_0144 [Colwellia psychrerythraea]